jgi:hypothetical protein
MSTNYNFEGDYKRKFIKYVEELEQSASSTSRGYRKQAIHELTNAYTKQVGKTPDGSALERLTNVLLHEELSDPRPDKMTLEEYPIMSERQYAKRTEGKTRQRNKAGVTTVEVPLTHGRNVATDGTDYTPHKRSFNNTSPR